MDPADGEGNPSVADTVMATLTANHQRFLDFLQSRIGSRQDAEEILQAAFVRTLQKADQIRHDESAIAWFYRLLRNAVVDYYRRESARDRAVESYARQISHAENSPDEATKQAICECVTRLVPLLKAEYAEILERVDLEGADVSSAAAELGLTPGNARVRLHRARVALREAVERSCRACATHGCIDCTCGERSGRHE